MASWAGAFARLLLFALSSHSYFLLLPDAYYSLRLLSLHYTSAQHISPTRLLAHLDQIFLDIPSTPVLYPFAKVESPRSFPPYQ